MKMLTKFIISVTLYLIYLNIVITMKINDVKWPDSSSTTSTQSSTGPSSTPSSTTFPSSTSFISTTTTTFPSSASTSFFSSSTSPSTPSFDKINILLARNVQLQATSSPSDYSITITCDDPSILPYVQANVTEDSTLIVTATTDCDVIIRAYTYQAIHLDSVSRLSATSYSYKGYQLRVVSMGNSQVQISNIGYDLAEFIFLGNSTVQLSGNVGKLTIISRGKGLIDATNIATANVNATLSGTGPLRVKSTANMNLVVSGIGNLTWCSPKVQMDVTYDMYKQKNIIYQC